MSLRRRPPSLTPLLLALLAGCPEATAPEGRDAETGLDAGAVSDVPSLDGGEGPPDAGPSESLEHVDLLWVVDPSSSVSGAELQLSSYLEVLTTGLTGRVDEIHAGVITADLGAFGFPVSGCSATGDDGVLRQAGNTSLGGCSMNYPPYLRLVPSEVSEEDRAAAIASFAFDLGCIATGASGCGFEQPLEAALKALTPTQAQPWTASSFSPRAFSVGTGHGSNPSTNAAAVGGRPFLHDDAVLVVVFLTDEDDCSAADGDVFNPFSSTYSSRLGLRCAEHPDALHPISRYEEALLELRRQPGQLVVQIVAGIPIDLSPAASAVALRTVLDDGRMTVQLDPTGARVLPVCTGAGGGLAQPARRLVGVAERLELRGARASVASICGAELDPAAAVLAGDVLEALGPGS